MGATFFTREITEAIVTIAIEMKEANRLKRKELELKYGKDGDE